MAKDRTSLQLETVRLLLRQFRETDLDAYAEMLADAETMRFIGEGKPMTRAETWRSIATNLGHWQLRGFGFYAVEEKNSGKLIGRIGLLNPEGWPGIELAWLLAPEFQGRGFAFEGAKAVRDHAFSNLHIPEIISVIHPQNVRSINLAKKLGESLFDFVWIFGAEYAIYKLLRGHV